MKRLQIGDIVTVTGVQITRGKPGYIPYEASDLASGKMIGQYQVRNTFEDVSEISYELESHRLTRLIFNKLTSQWILSDSILFYLIQEMK